MLGERQDELTFVKKLAATVTPDPAISSLDEPAHCNLFSR
jgi:hypothetical protein